MEPLDLDHDPALNPSGYTGAARAPPVFGCECTKCTTGVREVMKEVCVRTDAGVNRVIAIAGVAQAVRAL